MAIHVVISDKVKEEIARKIIENSDFWSGNPTQRHMRAVVRGMLMEAMSDVVDIVNGIDPMMMAKFIPISREGNEGG